MCKIYFCSQKAVGSHKKAVHVSSLVSIMESIDDVVQQCYEEGSEEIPVINNMLEWLRGPFEICDACD